MRNNIFSQKSIALITKLFFTVGAYFYIYYRISNSWGSTQNFHFIYPWTKNKSILLTIIFMLMFLNWLLESLKWKKLLYQIEPISLKISIKSVLIGITCSIFTPYRIGEYFGRPLLISISKRAESIVANIMGSISQNIITFSMGLTGITLLIISNKRNSFSVQEYFLIITSLGILILFLLVLFLRPYFTNLLISKIKLFSKWQSKFHFLGRYEKTDLNSILFISLVRYLVFSSQYLLLLWLFGVEISILNAFIAISLSYVFLFSIPGIPIADIGIRGSLALFFIGMFSNNDIAILSASFSLWIINLALPALIGSVYLMKYKR